MVSSAAPTVSACRSIFRVPFLAASRTPEMQPVLRTTRGTTHLLMMI